LSEADMLSTTLSTQRGKHYPFGETVWGLAGLVVLMTFGDVLVVAALAVAAVALAVTWWVHRQAVDRVRETEAVPASVSQLRPGPTRAHHLRGPRAA
jgi:Flp pilus assembly protein TadB